MQDTLCHKNSHRPAALTKLHAVL